MAGGISPDTARYHRGTTAGLNSVGSYQVAGRPFITGSTIASGDNEIEVVFPSVTKSITVINTDAGGTDVRVHFASKDTSNTISENHYITLNANQSSVTMNVKCKSIFISNGGDPVGDADFQLFAELTGIPDTAMFTLTGVGIDA